MAASIDRITIAYEARAYGTPPIISSLGEFPDYDFDGELVSVRWPDEEIYNRHSRRNVHRAVCLAGLKDAYEGGAAVLNLYISGLSQVEKSGDAGSDFYIELQLPFLGNTRLAGERVSWDEAPGPDTPYQIRLGTRDWARPAHNLAIYGRDIVFAIRGGASDQTSRSLLNLTAPMELYLLYNPLPPYLRSGVPILLLRMFVLAAQEQKLQTPEELVKLTVGICHGSREPLTGKVTDTRNHWLKYNTGSGSPSFLHANAEQTFHFTNYGGTFSLDAWLNAYRNWGNEPTVTHVNCYDQAAATQVALALAVDFRCVAWEYHQKFGFITRKASLVGWGPCNNPYFEDNPERMILDETDEERKPFTNHAFLSWHPGFRPWEDRVAFFKTYPDPANYTAPAIDFTVPEMRAIDACAGPHLGDEPRGEFKQPYMLPEGYGDGSTYWKSRDSVYNRAKYDTTKTGMLGYWNEDKGPAPHSNWTLGVNAIDDQSGEGHSVPIFGKDPLEDKAEFKDMSTFTNDLQGNQEFKGYADDVLNKFYDALNIASTDYIRVVIGDIKLSNNQGITKEMKAYKRADKIHVEYVSLRITTAKSHAKALELLKSRLTIAILASDLDLKDFDLSQGLGLRPRDDFNMIASSHMVFFVLGNLVLQLSGEKKAVMIKQARQLASWITPQLQSQ